MPKKRKRKNRGHSLFLHVTPKPSAEQKLISEIEAIAADFPEHTPLRQILKKIQSYQRHRRKEHEKAIRIFFGVDHDEEL